MTYGRGEKGRKGRSDPTKVAYPSRNAAIAGPAKAQWLSNYLTQQGIPGLTSKHGHVMGLSGYDVFVMAPFNQNHTGGVGGVLNAQARTSGKVPIMVRAISGMPPEGVLITMRLPDWALWLQYLVKADPQRWLGNDDREM
jgi:hypothetical protein